MANPFAITPANPLQALMAFDQSYQGARKRTQEDERKAALQQFAQSNPQLGPIGQLLGIDPVAAQTASNMELARANQAFRQQEAIRQQQNADRSFGLQQEAQRFNQQQAQRPDIQMYDTGEGGPKVPVAIDRNAPTPTVTALTPQGLPQTQPANPYSTGPMKEHEGKTALFADRAASAHKIISNLERINREPGGTIGAGVEKVLPTAVSNVLVSGRRGQLMDAKRAFINALLRRESGAVIQPIEFENYDKEYFPQLGDSDQQINAKRVHRAEVIKGLAREAGRNYRPNFALDDSGFAVSGQAPKDQARVSDGGWQTLPNGVKIREIQ